MGGKNAGRSGSRWRKLKADVYARGAVCCRCGQPIDYSLPYLDEDTGKSNPASKSVDHYPHPLSTHPHLAEDLGNLAAAHLGCNWEANDRPTTPSLGEPSEAW